MKSHKMSVEASGGSENVLYTAMRYNISAKSETSIELLTVILISAIINRIWQNDGFLAKRPNIQQHCQHLGQKGISTSAWLGAAQTFSDFGSKQILCDPVQMFLDSVFAAQAPAYSRTAKKHSAK